MENKKWCKNKFFISIIIYVFILLLAYFRAILFDQNFIIANNFVKGYIYLVFLPCVFYSLREERQLNQFIRLIILLGSFLSILSCIIIFSAFCNTFLFSKTVDLVFKYNLVNLMYQNGKTFRIMFSGILLQLCALFFSLGLYLEKGKIINFIVFILNCLGVFFSYSRGIFLGCFIGILIILFNSKSLSIKGKNRLYYIIFFLFLIFIFFIFFMPQHDIISFFLKRFFNNTEVESNNLRHEMKLLLYSLISDHIIIGNGAGAHIDLRDGQVEMVYHDILSKVGVIGGVTFLSPLVIMVMKKDRKDLFISHFSNIKYCSLAIVIAIFVASYTNPYLITSFGLLVYCLCMRFFSVDRGVFNA